MKAFIRLTLANIALFLVAACHLPSVQAPQSPVAVADQTALDERTLIAVELAYKAARRAGELAVDAGLVKGENAKQLRAANIRAYDGVKAARRAYEAGNASSYTQAAATATLAVADILALVGATNARDAA